MQLLEHFIPYPWIWFAGCFTLFIICTLIMGKQSTSFLYQRGIAQTPFSIMDLEFPGGPGSIAHIISGIQQLGDPVGKRSMTALRNNLLTDFVFMAGIYPAIFFLCRETAFKMSNIGHTIFIWLAAAQALAWLFDIVENFYLLHKLRKPYVARTWVHRIYSRMVMAKWGIATAGAFPSLFGLLYFWIRGNYTNGFELAGLILLGIIGLVLILAVYRTVNAIFDNEAEGILKK